MPQKYRVTTDQGTFEVTTDDAAPASAPVDASVARGGILHPLTSFLAPELESARTALDTATATPHGQPIMARSRTGTLYPSEEGTGAVNAAKSFARGAGGELLNQAEGVTSPAGLATAGLAKGVLRMVESPAVRGTVGRGMQAVGDFNITQPFRSSIGAMGDALASSAADASPAGVDRYLPSSGGLPAVQTPSSSPRIQYAEPTESMAPKPSYSASDVVKIKSLMNQGVSQDMALKVLEQAKRGINGVPD